RRMPRRRDVTMRPCARCEGMFVGATAPWGQRAARCTEASGSHRGTKAPRPPRLSWAPSLRPASPAFVALPLHPCQQKEGVMKTNRILVPVDGSAMAEAAVAEARRLARSGSSTLLLLRATDAWAIPGTDMVDAQMLA